MAGFKTKLSQITYTQFWHQLYARIGLWIEKEQIEIDPIGKTFAVCKTNWKIGKIRCGTKKSASLSNYFFLLNCD